MERRSGGRFFDGRSAAGRPVGVVATSAGLEIRDADNLLIAFWKAADLRRGDKVPGGGVRVRCAAEPNARLVVDDAGVVPAAPRRRGCLLLAGIAAVLALAVLAAGYAALPLLARAAVAAVPVSVERDWGRSLAAEFERHGRTCRAPAGTVALDGMVARLAQPLPSELRPSRVLVVDATVVNAIALPGGVMVVFRGLLDAAQGPDELAGVLAHELIHLRERHPAAAMVRGLGVGVMVGLLVGDTSGLVASGAAALLASSYTRADEAAADAGAVDLLRQAGIGSQGLAAFFRRLAARGSEPPQWMSTHPDSAARAAAVEAAADRRALPPALRDEEWQALKAICR
ncbi:MAG: M48 family metallopeptidase [Actinomycetota bacterium]